MDCEKYKEMISARLDGELLPDEGEALKHHLEGCPDCRSFLGKMEDLHNLTAKQQPLSLPSELEEKILAQTADSKKRRTFLTRLVFENYRIPKGIAWAAMILIVALTAALLSGSAKFRGPKDHAIQALTQNIPTQKVIITEENVIKTQTISGGVYRLKRGG